MQSSCLKIKRSLPCSRPILLQGAKGKILQSCLKLWTQSLNSEGVKWGIYQAIKLIQAASVQNHLNRSKTVKRLFWNGQNQGFTPSQFRSRDRPENWVLGQSNQHATTHKSSNNKNQRIWGSVLPRRIQNEDWGCCSHPSVGLEPQHYSKASNGALKHSNKLPSLA